MEDARPAVVSEVLIHLQMDPSEEVIPILGKLYLTGPEGVSAQAMRILGDLRHAGAVDWMKERILQKGVLSEGQVASMIYALGRVRSEDAYMLLKQTEKAVEGKSSRRWEMFYASLLQHRRPEDVATLLRVVLAEDEDSARYREALGLLLGEVDPALNPSNVFFANPAAVRKHWLRRLEEIERGASDEESLEVLGNLKDLVNSVSPEAMHEALGAFERLAADLEGVSPFEESIYRQPLELLGKGAGAEGKSYALTCLALSAMLTVLEEKAFPPPAGAAPVGEKVAYLLRNRPPKSIDEALTSDVLKNGERGEIVPRLISALKEDPASWGALRAVEMVGRLRAEEAMEEMIGGFRKARDEFYTEALRTALLRMGSSSVPHVVPLLESSDVAESSLALEILGLLPTSEGVESVLERSLSLYAKDTSSLLKSVYGAGSGAFLRFIEKEYRTGELEVGKVFVHLCRVNDLHPEQLSEIEKDVLRGEALIKERRRMMAGETTQGPSAVSLELECRDCGKKYHYEVADIHMHPIGAKPAEESGGEMIPYKSGVVIGDDLRCKNCQALNRMRLTARTMAQLTGESVRILAMQKGGARIPAGYPVKHVQLGEREGKPLTLTDAEKEHLEALGRSPEKPAAHLALGKFYEYVKELPEARRYYLQAVDLDSLALEAMAGLARLAHVEGNLKQAGQWIEDCYENLEKGHILLAEDNAAFKKAVREKRREYARELGVKPKDKPVKILYSMDVPEYPKNKPCPCGSGKKYKMCCMKTGGTEEA
jgi:hypothetical protein